MRGVFDTDSCFKQSCSSDRLQKSPLKTLAQHLEKLFSAKMAPANNDPVRIDDSAARNDEPVD